MFPHPLMFLVHVYLCMFAEVHLDLLKAYFLELDICDYLTRHLDLRRVGYEERHEGPCTSEAAYIRVRE